MPRIEPIPYDELPPECRAEIERRQAMEDMTAESMINQQIRSYAPQLMAGNAIERNCRAVASASELR